MNDLTSEGHDMLSSRVILSDDDFRRGCESPLDLENGFYKDINKLGPSYNNTIEIPDLEGPMEYEGRPQEFFRDNATHADITNPD
ncbi:hypothetical protein Tco_0652357 [Tanacetum coccineum]|uniref:Uncharacterized protein n=1 Tax=Tanacetum coccineum TaxID=301880 RepID=A0ABQ4WXL9_9ASTR